MNSLAQWFTWERAPCQVVGGGVKLAPLSSKSDSTFVDDRVLGYTFGCVFLCPVCTHSRLGSSWLGPFFQ